MPMIEATHDPVYDIPPGTWVTARVADIYGRKGNYGPQLGWKFRIMEPVQFAEAEVGSDTGVSVSYDRGSKLRTWLAAFVGDDVARMQSLDTDNLKGAVVKFQCSTNTSNNGNKYINVEKDSQFTVEVMPPGLANAPTAAAAAPPVVNQGAAPAPAPASTPMYQQPAAAPAPQIQQPAAPMAAPAQTVDASAIQQVQQPAMPQEESF